MAIERAVTEWQRKLHLFLNTTQVEKQKIHKIQSNELTSRERVRQRIVATYTLSGCRKDLHYRTNLLFMTAFLCFSVSFPNSLKMIQSQNA